MSYINELGAKAKKAEYSIGTASTKQKNDALIAIADALVKKAQLLFLKTQLILIMQ